MVFKLSKEAERDLRGIARYTVKAWGKAQAVRYLRGLNEAFIFLAENPMANRLRFELSPPVRIHHYKRHLIMYLPVETEILIIRVLHDHMDIDSQDNLTDG